MVRLYGVVHGGHTVDNNLRLMPVDLQPTIGMQESLERLPRGSAVGIESLCPEDKLLCLEHREDIFNDNKIELPYKSSESYWVSVGDLCQSFGHEVIWLENIQDWYNYNNSLLEHAKVVEQISNDGKQSLEGRISKRESYRKSISLNEELFKKYLAANKIHLLDRENTVLRNAKSAGCVAVVAGLLHTESWFIKNSVINKRYGVNFTKYSADVLSDPERFRLRYVDEALPDPAYESEHRNLKRSLNLLEKGRFSDDDPQFAGILDRDHPSRGYFEIFLEKNIADISKGLMYDNFGIAVIKGKITGNDMRFIRKYIDKGIRAADKVLSFQIKDDGDDDGGNHGIYLGENKMGNFYLERYSGSTPMQMSMSWYDLCQDDPVGQKNNF